MVVEVPSPPAVAKDRSVVELDIRRSERRMRSGFIIISGISIILSSLYYEDVTARAHFVTDKSPDFLWVS